MPDPRRCFSSVLYRSLCAAGVRFLIVQCQCQCPQEEKDEEEEPEEEESPEEQEEEDQPDEDEAPAIPQVCFLSKSTWSVYSQVEVRR